MILVWGSSERGKSQSIKKLAMAMPFTSIIKSWDNNNYDSFIIGTVKDKHGKDRIVGIENQGDPNSNQKAWIQACINVGCEVIVAASRSYGKTRDDAYQLARDNGYEVIEATTLFHVGGPILPNKVDLRELFAKNMIEVMMECLG